MKRSISLWLGMTAVAGFLALALAPANAQQPAPAAAAGATGKIHGRVINPTGQPQAGGNVSLSTDGGATLKFSVPCQRLRRILRRSACRHLHGRLSRGRYAGRQDGRLHPWRKSHVGEDTAQDVDMSRQEYIDKMTPEEKKQLEELKKTNCRGAQGQYGDQPAERRSEDRNPG